MPNVSPLPVKRMPVSFSKRPKAIRLQNPQTPCVDIESIGSSISNLLRVLLKNSYNTDPIAPISIAAQL